MKRYIVPIIIVGLLLVWLSFKPALSVSNSKVSDGLDTTHVYNLGTAPPPAATPTPHVDHSVVIDSSQAIKVEATQKGAN